MKMTHEQSGPTEEESCDVCMWVNGGDEVKDEHNLTLTIGQINLVRYAVEAFRYRSLKIL